MHKINLYFDMDGVLAKYDRHAYTGDDPLFMRAGSHYFRNVAPDDRLTDLMSYVAARPDQFEPKIITSLTNRGEIFLEQYHDKLNWLKDNIKDISFTDGENFIPVIGNKRRIASWLKRDTLDYRDVLIDDYNPNLKEWQKHGGLAVKYLNGINSPSFDGPMITEHMSSEDIVEMLRILSRANYNRRDTQPAKQSYGKTDSNA